MTYDLHIGDRTFSSWSLRGWLMLEKFDLPHRVHMVGLYTGDMAHDLAPLAPARLVPVLRTPEGEVIGETLAIAETLSERHPGAGMWPVDPAARSRARWLCAAMATGFGALRGNCPMQLRHVHTDTAASDAVATDLAGIDTLWAFAGERSDGTGPWLFGSYSIADAFFAPVCARIVGYDLPMSDRARAYCDTTVSDPAFRAWRDEGLKVTYDPMPYHRDGPTRPWPGD